MRIDAEGFHRRRFLRWCSYRWEELRPGHATPTKNYDGFNFPHRAWGQKKLSIAGIPDTDGEYVMARCFAEWVPPAALEIPDTLVIHELNGLYFPSRTIHFDRSGVSVKKRKRTQRYSWSELKPINIDRYHGQSVGFIACDIPIPGESLQMSAFGRGSFWRGPETEVVAAYFEKFVPADNISYCLRGGQPRSLSSAESELTHLQKEYKRERRMSWVISVVCFAVSIGSIGVAVAVDEVFDMAIAALNAGFWLVSGILALVAPWRFHGLVAAAEERRRAFTSGASASDSTSDHSME